MDLGSMLFRSVRLIAITTLTLTALLSAQDSRPARKAIKWEELSPKAKQKFASKSLEQFAVYWTDEAGWHSELQMRNNLAAQPLTVTPSLRSADGTEVALPPVTIGINDVITLNVHDLLPQSAPQMMGAYGSVVFRYQAPGPHALYAAVMVHDPGHAISFHLDAFPKAANYDVGSREGIWWLPNQSASDYLILTNLDDKQPLTAHVQLFSADGKRSQQPIQLRPRSTNRVSVRALVQQAGLQGNYGGIRIDAPHGAAALDSAHVLFDETANFSLMMKMFDHDPRSKFENRSWGNVKQWTLRAPMLALTNPDPALAFPKGTTLHPRLFIRNNSPKSYVAQVSFHWRSATAEGNSDPTGVTLASDQTVLLDVADLQSKGVLPLDAQWASVSISAPTLPEEFMAVAGSYDETMRYGAQTPFSDQLAFHWEGGAWHVDSTRNSLIAAGNGGDKPIQARLSFIYNNGKDSYVIEQQLAPGQQLWADMANIIRNQVPDKNGKTLPLDVSYGTYRLEDLTDQAVGNLYEGKLIVDKTFGYAAYGCMICCGYFGGGMMGNDPFDIPIWTTGSQSVQGVDSCSQNPYVITGFYSSWWTGDTNIATANMSAMNGVGSGDTYNYAWGLINVGDGQSEIGHGNSCPQQWDQPTGGVSVLQLACSPVSAVRGTSVTCTVTAPTGTAYSNWKFTDGNSNLVTRSGSGSTSNSWAGTMVVGGTVTVDAIPNGGTTTPLAFSLSVVNRNWHIAPATTADPTVNGYFYALPVPPQPTGLDAGLAHYHFIANYSGSATQTIGDNGPNNGYTYFTQSIVFTTGNKTFEYVINPDLESSSSDFSSHQCELDGYISWQHLYDGALRHEFNSITDSHYANYKQAWNANNGGDYIEQQVAVPGQNISSWLNSASSTLNSYYGTSGTIANSTAVEPSPVNEVNGQDLYINYKNLSTGTYPHTCP